jgi:hypothetical protein
VGETKAEDDDIGKAIKEARDYSTGLLDRGMKVLAAGVAGNETGKIAVQVDKWARSGWKVIEYRSQPIQWLPTPEEANRLLIDDSLFDLQPRVPPAEILAKRGEEINRILRECKINDPLRPAIMGAMMLAIWESKGNIRTDSAHVLLDINEACKRAFVKAGKPEVAESLTVPVENSKLAARAQHILYILRLLNITTLTSEHDYLGQLYETFFRFTGGNTIGQYFTPRHITRFMADLCNVSGSDLVVDPACGTGGFLIAAMNKMLENVHLTSSQLDSMVKKHLRGYTKCDTGEQEIGYEKVAIYEHPVFDVQHAARQLQNGRWTSKIGEWEDISHRTPQCMECDDYGEVVQYMKRRREEWDEPKVNLTQELGEPDEGPSDPSAN